MILLRWLGLTFTLLPFASSLPFALWRRQLGNVLDSALGLLSTSTTPVLDSINTQSIPGGSIVSPLLDTVEEAASGQGLVQGLLGTIEGAIGEEQTFDYVVAGGGTAGIPIAVRLAQAGFSVALIEAGIFYEIGKPVLGTTPAGAFFGVGWSQLDQIPTVDWGFTTEPQWGNGFRRMHYARGRCCSHTTFTPPNNDIRRANASTLYDPTAFVPICGPVQVGYTNWVSVWATWLERGLQAVGIGRTLGFNHGQLLGYHYSQSTIRSDKQSRSASDEYLALVRGNPLLKVYSETMVKQILFSGATAIGVRVSALLLERNIYARREVILSAGVFQSPQMLMVSGVGPPETLASMGIPIVSPLYEVGQNMWDHIILGPSHEVNFDTVDRFLHDPVVLAETLAEYLSVPPTGPLTSNVVELLGWEKLPEKYRATWSPETQTIMAHFPADWPELEHVTGNGHLADFWFPVLQQPLNFRQYASVFTAMVATTSRGNVTIRSPDANIPPIISPNYLETRANQEVAISWFRRMREIWATPDLQSITIPQPDGSPEFWPGWQIDTDEEILDLIRSSFMTVWHASSTCKMGLPQDPMAVVDTRGRVYVTQNLRVCDASIMPILPPGHPQSTIYALAEKIAEDIILGY
ncbi:Versicolorin B synthase [Cercospora beticola]|uniref:Versicolorin B synthase n=1 Tax=Cercospora beticola TaxID=122368 RepID=A0A2G5I7E3_CERBT|nr:Versicolorin B synthase [Cercospora beticola]PIB00728.1 Versicolorin B synthase [Cercospora beticola]WPA97679.1 hypothetical protein RHO25_002290 [Cercospora beticola]